MQLKKGHLHYCWYHTHHHSFSSIFHAEENEGWVQDAYIVVNYIFSSYVGWGAQPQKWEKTAVESRVVHVSCHVP